LSARCRWCALRWVVMAKKQTNRQRQAVRDKIRREERAIAVAAASRDAHARLVAERHQDPRFVQRVRTATGFEVSLSPQAPGGQRVLDALAGQRERFREKFGREIGDDDPLIFDPDADVPTPLTEQARSAVLEELALSVAESGGLDPAYIYAWRDVGYIVTEATEHLFSAVEVQAYFDAVSDHMDDDGDWDEDDDEGDEESTPAEVLRMAADSLERVVAAILQERTLDPIRMLMEGLDESELEDEELEVIMSSTVAVLASWLVEPQEQGLDSSAVMAWIGETLPEQDGQDALVLSGMIGFAFGPDLTIMQAADRLGERFVPAHTALAAGIAATAGNGDAHWLRQHDPGAATAGPERL
jgi:hypothetical protein